MKRHHIHWWKLRTEWYRKKLILKQPPYFINLEPTGFCNLHCKICSYQQDRGKGYVSLELAQKAIEDAAAFGVSEIRFFLAGEPLFHPHLGELIQMAKQRGLLTMVHTNATILDEKRATALLDSQLDTLSLSFDGENKAEYEAIRIGGTFEPTLENVLRFLRLKKERGSALPHTTLQVIKQYHDGAPPTPQVSAEFKQLFAGLPIDRWLLLYPFAWAGQEQKDFVRPSGRKTFPCPVLWQSLSVGWDGRIFGCCGDLNGLVVLGNVHTQRLQDVWNGDQIVELRRLHVQKRFAEIPLCRECDAMYMRVHPALRDVKELLFGKWTPI